jgi:hypothetical protein
MVKRCSDGVGWASGTTTGTRSDIDTQTSYKLGLTNSFCDLQAEHRDTPSLSIRVNCYQVHKILKERRAIILADRSTHVIIAFQTAYIAIMYRVSHSGLASEDLCGRALG